MIAEIEKILDAGIQAPSGSNSQPWKFRIEGEKLLVFAEYKKDHPVLNYRNRGTLIAQGALLENITIASRNFGYEPQISLFPNSEDQNCVASVTFRKSDRTGDPLFEAISKRATNRKPYSKSALSEEQLKELTSISENFPGLQLRFETSPDKIQTIAQASSVNEIVMLEDKQLHSLFYNEITWNEQEDSQRRMGFFLKTLEMNFGQRSALRLFKSWSIIKFFNKLGAARGIASSNAKTYAAVGAIGVVVVPDNDLDFLKAGRLMERVWLNATKMGLGFHLVTGILYLWQRIQDSDFKDLSDEHRRLTEEAYKSIANAFNIAPDQRIAVLFRIGNTTPPSARSKRIELEKLIEK